jgi:hypothetical protein
MVQQETQMRQSNLRSATANGLKLKGGAAGTSPAYRLGDEAKAPTQSQVTNIS